MGSSGLIRHCVDEIDVWRDDHPNWAIRTLCRVFPNPVYSQYTTIKYSAFIYIANGIESVWGCIKY
jgi:hypothetical protein